MLTPVIRMVVAALTNATTGVNAQLLALALDGTDARPDPVAAIISPTEDDAAVRPTHLVDWPVLSVTCAAPVTTTKPGVQGMSFDAPSVAITIAHITRDGDLGAKEWRDTDYILRATAKSLNAGLFASDKAAARVRGTVSILKQNSMTFGPVTADLGNAQVTGAVDLNLHARETA